MSVQIARMLHPFALFCRNLFHAGSIPSNVEADKRISLADLAAMPKETKLLLAHCLKRDNPNLTLLQEDNDAGKLLSARWLISIPCKGLKCYRVKPEIWRRLRRLSSRFLSQDLLSDLKSYRKRKSAQYPWVWS